jgi:CRP/FNR family transcriptional regulator, cyclic AMP receptor protein
MSAIDGQDGLYEMLARAGEKRELAAGSVIFEQGDEASSMYLLLSGTVGIKRGDEVIRTVEAPGMFGEMALIDYAPRSMTTVAQEDAEIVEIPERRFWVLVHETPRFAQLVMRVLADRLRQLDHAS